MIQIVNMLNNIEKEVDLERQGMLRIKRFAGNTSQITDDRWYQARAHRIPKSKANLDDVSQMGETQPRGNALSSILTRFSNQFKSRRQPVNSKS